MRLQQATITVHIATAMVTALGTLLLCGSVVGFYATFATHDYRPIVTASLGLWLLGIICLAIPCWRGLMPWSVFMFVCGPPTLLAWMDMQRRGHLVVEYISALFG